MPVRERVEEHINLGFGAKDAEGDPKPQMFNLGLDLLADRIRSITQ